MSFSVIIKYSVNECDPAQWDQLGENKPFTSHRWYQFGEKVLSKDKPFYIIVNQNDQPIARATFWIKQEDILPISSIFGKKILSQIFRRWPLITCQSPLSNTSGLILPDTEEKTKIFDLIMDEAVREMQKNQASFLVLDYLTQLKAQENTYSGMLYSVALPEQGTSLKIEWEDFDSYLKRLSKNERKTYKRNIRRAAELEVEIKILERAPSIDESIQLIVEHNKHYKQPLSPWIRGLLKNNEIVNSAWIGAYVGNKLVGCELLLEDHGYWVAAALGRDYSYPYVYFVLGYESIRYVIENRGEYLHWGTGAYEYKKRLGFQLTDDHYVSFMARNKLVDQTLRKIAPRLVSL